MLMQPNNQPNPNIEGQPVPTPEAPAQPQVNPEQSKDILGAAASASEVVQAPPEAAQLKPVERGGTSAPEKKSAQVLNNQPSGQAPADDQQVVGAPLGQVPVINPVQSTQPATSTSGPAFADDVDVIEKEWVNKAKDVVNKTKSDPYQQEKQVAHLQADYLKKRYGKDVDVPQD